MRIIALANQKGGCGKTTTAINLSSSLSFKGKRVLLIDCDPQAHATLGLNQNPSGLDKTLYDLLAEKSHGVESMEDIIIPIKDNFDLVPSSIGLSAFEQEMAGRDGREHKLSEAIKTLKSPYDYIMIDCPPSIGLLCFNALRACEEVIIPIDMSLFSLRGVAKLIEIILLIKEKLDHDITPRALVTMFDYRTRYSKRVLEKVKERFGNNVFEAVVRYNIRLRETVDHGLPIGDYDKRAIGFMDYETLAEEVIDSELLSGYNRALLTAQEILINTEGFIDSVVQASLEEPLEEEEEQAYSFESETSGSTTMRLEAQTSPQESSMGQTEVSDLAESYWDKYHRIFSRS